MNKKMEKGNVKIMVIDKGVRKDVDGWYCCSASVTIVV